MKRIAVFALILLMSTLSHADTRKAETKNKRLCKVSLMQCLSKKKKCSRKLRSTCALLRDFDADGIKNKKDNCRYVSNPLQEDSDRNGIGNACDVNHVNEIVTDENIPNETEGFPVPESGGKVPTEPQPIIFNMQICPQLPGDYNFDNKVDGSDFMVWQRTLPEPLSVWKENFGSYRACDYLRAMVYSEAFEVAIGDEVDNADVHAGLMPLSIGLIDAHWYSYKLAYSIAPISATGNLIDICSDPVGYQPPISITSPLTIDTSGKTDIYVALCIKAINQDGGYLAHGSAMAYAWHKTSGPQPPRHTIFATSNLYSITSDSTFPPASNTFHGTAGADYQCTKAAKNANLPGTATWNGVDPIYKALLSKEYIHVKERISVTAPVRNSLGSKVANNHADLFDGTIENPIATNEFSQSISYDPLVWTGMGTNFNTGELVGGTFNCSDFLEPYNFGYDHRGSLGNIYAVNTDWLGSNQYLNCGMSARLYCIGPAL